MNFHIIDWVILVAYLAASVFLGLRARRHVDNMEGYFVAGRKIRVSLGVCTLIATEIGIVTFMYAAELGYLTGFACFFLGLTSLLGYMLIGKTGFIVTALRRLKVMTIPEFYELRYGRGVRLIGGSLLFLGGVLNMGIFLKFDGIFLAETIGLGQEMLVVIMILMLVIVLLYTILGGMLSVVVTDFLQFVVLVIGMVVATIGILNVVSPAELVNVVTRQFGEAGVNPFVHPRFGWAFILWIAIASVAASALWQPATSKVLSSDSPETGRKVFLYSGLALAGRFMIPMFWGVAALAVLGPNVASTLAMPRLLGMVVPTGFLGLMIAGMMAASMSTYSAYLLAWSSVATRDIVAPLRRVPLSEKGNVRLTRAIAAIIGFFLLFFGLLYEIPETAFQYLALTGAMYTAGALGCVAGGIYWKKANSMGAYWSLILGAVGPVLFLLLTSFKEQLPGWLWFAVDVNISGFLSFVLAGCGMVFGSLLTQRTDPPRILHYPEEEL
jgi:solute:Na+ symporter, SSS family